MSTSRKTPKAPRKSRKATLGAPPVETQVSTTLQSDIAADPAEDREADAAIAAQEAGSELAGNVVPFKRGDELQEAADKLRRESPLPEKSPAWKVELRQKLQRINQRHFVITLAGRTVIGAFEDDDALGRRGLVLSQIRDLTLRYANQFVQVGEKENGDPVFSTLTGTWVKWDDRRQFDGMGFYPQGDPPAGRLNLWQGFGVTPQRGTCDRILRHLLEVLCDGNDQYMAWLMGWMAFCVQHPEKAAEVAVVVRGLKGTGKGMAAKIMRRIFKHHSLQISQAKHLTGSFNDHLKDCLFLHIDEAYFAGDRSAEGVLKALITEDTIQIEPKGMPLFTVPNRLKIMMTSNNEHIIPATADERRYFVLDASDRYRGDRPYFEKLAAAIEGQELAAFLDLLRNYDLSGWDQRHPPHTVALNAQKGFGDSVVTFWRDSLMNGELMRCPQEVSRFPDGGWPTDYPCQFLHAGYVAYTHELGDRHPFSIETFGKKLGRLLPGGELQRIRPRIPWNEQNLRPFRYALPSLDQCRQAFALAMNDGTTAWPDAAQGRRDGAP